jgi:adenylate cyclase
MINPRSQSAVAGLDADDLAALVETSCAIAREVHLPKLLRRILAEATRLTDSPDGSVLLLDEARSALYFGDAIGSAGATLMAEWGRSGNRRVPLVGSKAGQVFTSMTSVTVDAIPVDLNHFKGVDSATRATTQSMVCVPLVAGAGTGPLQALGVVQILNKRSGNYTARDRLLLERFAEQAAIALDNARLVADLYANKGLYTSDDDDVDPRELLARSAWSETLSVLIADMRGFTQLCQLVGRPERTQALLNQFLGVLADAVLAHRGVVNKFLGDGVLALFRGNDHAKRSVECALRMLREFDVIKSEWLDSHNVRLNFVDLGIGISTEDVILGAVGNNRVWDFTAIGNGVNLAAHLMEHARDGKRLLVDKITFRAARSLINRYDGPEEFELRKPGQSVAHPYERYVIHPGAPAGTAAAPQRRVSREARLFISYSHRDEHWRSLLRTHLQPYVTAGTVEVWDDTAIEAGAAWKQAIDRALEGASVALFLVSPNLLASPFVLREELAPVLERARSKEMKLLWAPVTASSYEETAFEALQAAMNPAIPLDQMSEPQQHLALVSLCKVIKAALDSLPNRVR